MNILFSLRVFFFLFFVKEKQTSLKHAVWVYQGFEISWSSMLIKATIRKSLGFQIVLVKIKLTILKKKSDITVLNQEIKNGVKFQFNTKCLDCDHTIRFDHHQLPHLVVFFCFWSNNWRITFFKIICIWQKFNLFNFRLKFGEELVWQMTMLDWKINTTILRL